MKERELRGVRFALQALYFWCLNADATGREKRWRGEAAVAAVAFEFEIRDQKATLERKKREGDRKIRAEKELFFFLSLSGKKIYPALVKVELMDSTGAGTLGEGFLLCAGTSRMKRSQARLNPIGLCFPLESSYWPM